MVPNHHERNVDISFMPNQSANTNYSCRISAKETSTFLSRRISTIHARMFADILVHDSIQPDFFKPWLLDVAVLLYPLRRSMQIRFAHISMIYRSMITAEAFMLAASVCVLRVRNCDH